MATIKFEDEKKQVQDDFGFSGEMPAQSAGAVSRRRKLLGEVIHPAAPAGAGEGTVRGCGGIKTASTSEYVAGAGQKFPHTPRARRGLVPGIFAATAAARHSLEESGGGEVNGQV